MSDWDSDAKRWGHYEDEEETVERVVRVDGRAATDVGTVAAGEQRQRPQVYGTYGGGFTAPPEEIGRLVAEHRKQLARAEAAREQSKNKGTTRGA